MIASALRRTGQTGAPPSITWHTAFWASDPSWSNPGDGNAVTSWSDYSGNGRTASVSGSTAALTYRATSSKLNNQPAVEASGGSASSAGTTDRRLVTSSFSSLAGPLSAVLIGFTGNTSATVIWCDGAGTGTTDRLVVYNDASNFAVWASSAVNFTPVNKNGHLLVGYVSDAGSGDFVNLDGTSSTTGNAGTTGVPITKVALFGRSDGGFVGPVTLAFYALYQGNVTSDPNWSAFKTWVASTYGLTIA